jgi:uncharacterized membrane protein YidH (DUF202 family)
MLCETSLLKLYVLLLEIVMKKKDQPQSIVNNEQTEFAKIIRDLELLAMVRTKFSSERSLLAWMRTSVSLFTFGFTIIQFVDYLGKRQKDVQFLEEPYWLGLILICVGILVLVPAAVQHVRRFRRAKELGMPTISGFSLPIGVATALFVIGIVTLIGIV